MTEIIMQFWPKPAESYRKLQKRKQTHTQALKFMCVRPEKQGKQNKSKVNHISIAIVSETMVHCECVVHNSS